MFNLSVILEESARLFPAKIAFSYRDDHYTYEQVNEWVNKLANGLQKIGIQPGDKVALTCPNIPAFPIIYYAVIKSGAIVVPLSVLLKKDEVIYQLNDSNAKAYCCFTGTKELPMGQT